MNIRRKIRIARYNNGGAKVHTDNQRVDYQIHMMEGDLEYGQLTTNQFGRTELRLRALRFVQQQRRQRGN